MGYATRLAAAGLCLAASATLAGDRIDVKTGLWEMTQVVQTSGMPPIPEDMLAKLPPDQRDRILASMQGAMNGTHTHKSCLTQKDLDHPFEPDQARDHCKQTVVSQTSTSMEAKFECSDPSQPGQAAHGTFKVHTTSTTSAEGTIDMDFGARGQSMSSHATFKSRWLGADCGDVKPARKQN